MIATCGIAIAVPRGFFVHKQQFVTIWRHDRKKYCTSMQQRRAAMIQCGAVRKKKL
jgi:hypothetical protein